MSKFVILIFLLGHVWATFSQNNDSEEIMDVFRLPCTTKPESYDLFLIPTMNGLESSFCGEVKIIIVAIESTNTITLNAKELDITKVIFSEFNGQPSNEIKVVEYTIVPKNEQIVIQLESDIIPNNKYMVTISFAGKMRKDNTSFFIASYIEDKVKKWVAVTKFEGPYARRNFPCFDEPALKAVFHFSIVKPKDQIVLSNMPIKDTKKGSNNVEIVYFEPTPLMSIYLFTFFVGDYVTKDKSSKISVYTHKNSLDLTNYVSTEAPKHLKIMEDFTGIPYNMPKTDMLGIPNYMSAIENWGINVYDENLLLINDDSITKAKIVSITTIQHEYSHNWFGNYVTCEWWDYLWLNEGFASYFEYFATGMVQKTWPVEEWFYIKQYQLALAMDQKPNRAMTSPINTIEEIAETFDFVSYEKAASVLRMLKCLMTEELFQLSLREYLTCKLYASAKPDDLFEAFDKVLKKHNYNIGNELTVNEFMSNWTLQSGYPVISIEKDDLSNTFVVTQKQFLLKNTDENNTNYEYKAWHVGLTFTTEASSDFSSCQPTVWTSKTSKTTQVPAPPNCGWHIFNVQSIGFYRVLYDTKNYLAIIKQLNDDFNAIHVINRAQIIDDAFNFAEANLLDYSIAFSLTTYLVNEPNETPFLALMNTMEKIEHRMRRDQEANKKLRIYLSSLFGSLFNKLQNLVSSGNIEFNVTKAWNDISILACHFGNADCNTKALEYFNKWQTEEKIPADIKQAAFSMGFKQNSDSAIFKKLYELYTSTILFHEKEPVLYAIATYGNKEQLNEFLNHVFDGPDGPFNPSEYSGIFYVVSKSSILGTLVLFEFLSSNFDKILNKLPDGENVIIDLFDTLANTVVDKNLIDEIKDFKDTFKMSEDLREEFQTIYDKYIPVHVAWFEKQSGIIIKWLDNNCIQ